MISGPLAVRSWWRSSSKMTSLTQWSWFSIPQCPWIQAATCSGWASVMDREQTRVDHLHRFAPGLVVLGGSGASDLDHLNRPGFVRGSDDMEGSLSWDLRKCPDELRERATRMALEALADPARAKGAIRRIGEELGVHPEALRTWVKKAQVDGGLRPGTTTDEAQRIKELEKEIRELRRANAILKSASAFLSRRSVSARPADLPVHRDQEGGVRGLADLQGAHWRRSQDRPEHLTHARRSRPPSTRSLRDKDPQDRDQTSP